MPVLEQLFSRAIQLNPITYLCHVTPAFSEHALKMGCTGIEEAMSICNIAVVNAFFCHYWFSSRHGLELNWKWELEWSSLRQEEERSRLIARIEELERELGAFSCLMKDLEQEWKLVLSLQLEPVWEQELDKEYGEHKRKAQSLIQCLERQRPWLRNKEKMQLLKEARRFELKIEQKRKGERMMSAVMKEFHKENFKVGVCTNTNEGFHELVFDVNEEIRICMSPVEKWIEAGDVLKMRLLQTGNNDPSFDKDGNPKTFVGNFRHVTFTNDGLYCVFSGDSSLKALSLQTGTVFTSVSGCNPIYLARESEFGYLFRSDTKERAIPLTSLFYPFKFLAESNVRKSIGAIFCSSNTVLSVSSDSKITSWETTASKEGITFICEYLLTESGVQSPPVKNSLLSSVSRRSDGTAQLVKPVLQSFPVKNCLLSSDGSLIAIHQNTKVRLYSFKHNTGENKFFRTVYESKCEFTIPCFEFSADSSLLLFCIQDSRRSPPLYVWDVQQEVMAASFKSPGLLTIECC